MLSMVKRTGRIFYNTVNAFIEDNCFAMAGALAYYTIFSLPALLVIVIALAGAIFGEEAARGELESQMAALVGDRVASQIQGLLQNANRPGGGSLVATLLGIGALVFGATGAFAQLQIALNTTWHVRPDPSKGGIMNFITKRMMSFGMVLGLGFLLVVSLVVSAVLTAFGTFVVSYLPGDTGETMLQWTNNLISFLFLTAFFAALFKIMPDAKVAWRDVWVGAAFTAILFAVGKFAIGYYIGQSDITSTYGAAGSLVLILLWVYYSALMLLFGAEFTQIWANRYGKMIIPETGAVAIETQELSRDKIYVAPIDADEKEPPPPPAYFTGGRGGA